MARDDDRFRAVGELHGLAESTESELVNLVAVLRRAGLTRAGGENEASFALAEECQTLRELLQHRHADWRRLLKRAWLEAGLDPSEMSSNFGEALRELSEAWDPAERLADVGRRLEVLADVVEELEVSAETLGLNEASEMSILDIDTNSRE